MSYVKVRVLPDLKPAGSVIRTCRAPGDVAGGPSPPPPPPPLPFQYVGCGGGTCTCVYGIILRENIEKQLQPGARLYSMLMYRYVR